MDEEDEPVQQSRTAFATRFFNQVYYYKRLLFKYWWIPLLTVGLGLGIQVYLLKHTRLAFMSEGRMIVNAKLAIPNANVYSEDVDNFFGTQVALMQSDSVINRVKLHLQSTHPELLPAPVKINVLVSPKTSIFNLQAVGGDENYTRAYLQAIMDEYISLKRDLLANFSSATQTSMREELAQMAKEIQKSKEVLLNYQSSNSVVFLQPNGGNNAADYLSYLTRQLDERKSELLLLNNLNLDQNLERQQGIFSSQNPVLTAAQPNPVSQRNSDLTPQPSPANAATNNDVSFSSPTPSLGEFEVDYLQAKQQILLLNARRDELIAKSLSLKAPEIVALDEEIAHQRMLLKIYQEQSQEQLKNRQITLEVQIQGLENQIQEWELKAVEVSKKLSDFESLKENEKRLQALYDQMQANLQALDMNGGIGQESVTILEPATPAIPAPLERAKHLTMAALISLVLGIGLLVLISRLDDRPNSFAELEQLFDIPVLGQIPLVKAKNKKIGVLVLQVDDDRYPLIEAYRSLRSAFLYKDSLKGQPKDQPKSIVITSASPNDGKSMTAVNFAITLAQAGARVLLIDADLRRGLLNKHFPATTAAGHGLAEVLAGQSDWFTAVVQTHIPNLHIMPRGKSPRHSHNTFAAAGKFVAEIAGHYDYYIFDSAPVMVADDVLSLAPNVDGVIMVIRAGFTSGRIAQAALDLLRQRRVNVIGLVFNAVERNNSDYYHYRFKEYYPQPPPA